MEIIELNSRTLRAIAHPLRMRILGLLRVEGPATATSLAARLGESSGTTSWHLRQLAEHGFIVQDSERGNRRERWWQAAHRYTRVPYGKFVDDPETAGALAVFLQEAAEIYYRHATSFVAQTQTWGREWVEAASFSDDDLPLTVEEAIALQEDLHAVLVRHRREREPGDVSVRVQLQVFPRSE